ncbi:MAG: TetM/TetW/TetO/TetS family tetracycline resistance ribosomal protection protein, partial [Clostridia bacterium]|nr:TetM/TetW/TetO/TetS family tetracycline resistance ribosomal protection protein [Clostridia bacterium]
MKKLTLGILAHVDSGKTTLSEALMYLSGNIKKLGRVDRRDAFLDTFSLERERGITIFSKQAVLRYKDAVFTLLDTPGHVDFSAETERTLQVLDYAILVISGTDGVQSHTLTLWKLLQKYGVPCFVFINKTDLPGADPDAALAQLREKLSDGCVDFSAKDEAFFEEAALCDEALLEYYTENGTVPDEELRRAIRARKIFPCLSGSALRLDGVEDLLDCIYEYTEIPARPSAFAGRVFKLSEDKQGARLTFLKITGGKLRAREVLQSAKNTAGEKINQIRIYSGEKYTVTDEADAGSVVAVTGITFARPGDGLGAEEDAPAPVLEPVMTYGVTLPEGTDAHAALEKFRLLEREDPALHVEWDDRHAQIRVRLMGDVQMEILKAVALDRFGLDVSFGKGRIIYKETIADTVEGVGHFEPLRHYAEVHLILKPGKPGSGLVFRSACSEDKLEKNWQRLILTHLYEKTHVGVLTGSPITDMEIILATG